MNRKKLISVCSSCLKASCWQGYFYCDEYKNADVLQKTREELEGLNYEDSGYW